jgi:dienelactone hydrolase
MIVHAYRALEALAKHRQIEASKIAVMGFSRGAQSALYSNVTRFEKMHGSRSIHFAAHIAVYPGCYMTFRSDTILGSPLLMLHGAADDWNPAHQCREYADRLAKEPGNTVRYIEYPDATHVFDGPVNKTLARFPNAQKFGDCRMVENESGVMINQATNQPFAYTDACVQKGTTIVYNDAATKKAREDVRAFLKDVFRVE